MTAISQSTEAVATCLDALFDSRVVRIVRAIPAHDGPFVDPITNARDRRKIEFATGRACAAAALARLGAAQTCLSVDGSAAPVWPAGYCGSISHSGALCVAAAARTQDGLLSLGIDIEGSMEFEQSLVSKIINPSELDDIVRTTELSLLDAARLAFCIKEAFFKCQYPLTARVLDFRDIEVSITPGNGFNAALLRERIMDFPEIPAIKGKFVLTRPLIAAGATCEREAM